MAAGDLSAALTPPMAADHADWVLVPVHNRRATTLGLLQRLATDKVLAWAHVLVIDDGSSDDTSAAVRAEFPGVEILAGDGTWWWGGAIRRGMEYALTHGAQRIYWLNDDCRPPAGGLSALRELVLKENCVAWMIARTPRGWSYGGHRKTAFGVRRCSPEEELAGRSETFSGNCVALPRSWVERVGLPDDAAFPHGLADLDYGLRLKQAGAPLRVLPGFSAESSEPAQSATESWLGSSRSMRAIWRNFSSPRSFLYFPAWRRFSFRHWGPVWGAAVFVAPYLRWAGIAFIRTWAPPLARALARRRATKPESRSRATTPTESQD